MTDTKYNIVMYYKLLAKLPALSYRLSCVPCNHAFGGQLVGLGHTLVSMVFLCASREALLLLA